MDSVTQAALGAAIGDILLSKKAGTKGAILGALVATIPDLDVVLLPFLEPIKRLSTHRGFSHSILFSIACALLLAYFLQRIKWTKDYSYARLLLFTWLCLFTHIILDAFTSYGTLLYLPFSDMRVSFDSINIVDPFYTLPLLIGLSMSIFKKRDSNLMKWGSQMGLVFSTIYLLITLTIKQDVNSKFREVFHEAGINNGKLLTMPVGVGSFHWYGLGKTSEGFWIGDFSYFKREDVELTFFPSNDVLLNYLDTKHVEVMKWFAKDFYHVVENGDSLLFYNMQVDMQGLYNVKGRMAPTRGFFILDNKKGGELLGSGRH